MKLSLTERECYRIRLESWRAWVRTLFLKVGENPNPYTEIELDEYNKRLYIIEHGTRRLHGKKRNARRSR